MIFPLLIIPFTTLLFVNFVNYLFRAGGLLFRYSFFGSSLSSPVKLVTLLSMQINLAYSVILWSEYPLTVEGFNLAYPANSWFELHHNLNLPFIILSNLVLIIAVLTSWYSITNSLLVLNLFLLIKICLIGFLCAIIRLRFMLYIKHRRLGGHVFTNLTSFAIGFFKCYDTLRYSSIVLIRTTLAVQTYVVFQLRIMLLCVFGFLGVLILYVYPWFLSTTLIRYYDCDVQALCFETVSKNRTTSLVQPTYVCFWNNKAVSVINEIRTILDGLPSSNVFPEETRAVIYSVIVTLDSEHLDKGVPKSRGE